LKEKVSQQFIVGFFQPNLDQEFLDFLKEYPVGGVILFKRNYESPGQLAELINQLQGARSSKSPLLVSVDHEGGGVFRFEGLTHFPEMARLGEIDSPKLTFDVHQAMGEELKALGINVDFAPVADVNTNRKNPIIGERAFGSDPDLVARHVSAAVRGLKKAGVMSCLKHFPGHGDTKKDSHLTLPKVDKSWEEILRCEAIPFKEGVKSKADLVMTAHILNKQIDPNEPATLSAVTLGKLRSEFKFSGPIVSDDMEMKAVYKDESGVGKTATDAIRAGCDLLIYRNFKMAQIAIDSVLKAVEKNELDGTLVERSNQLILDLKSQYQIGEEVYVPDVTKKIGTDQTKKLLKDIKKSLQEIVRKNYERKR